MSMLRDCAYVNSRRMRVSQELGEREKPRRRYFVYERCPTCGGMVIKPCILCNLSK